VIDTIVFDAEGVVLDTEGLWDVAQAQFLADHGVRYERAEVKHLLSGRSLHEGTAILQERYELTGELSQLVLERHTGALRLFAARAAFVDGFCDFYEQVRVRFKTCIATALDPELLSVMDGQLDLTRLFAGNVYTVADVAHAKPEPDVFLFAAARVGSSPETCVVVEDSPNGIEAARRAGMRCVALATTYDPTMLVDADHVAASWEEVDLEGWFS